MREGTRVLAERYPFMMVWGGHAVFNEAFGFFEKLGGKMGDARGAVANLQ